MTARRRGSVKDWRRARRLFEIDGKSLTAIADTLDVSRQTVSSHRQRDGWCGREEIAREATKVTRDKSLREFVRANGPAVLANFERKHEANSRLLDLVHSGLDSIEDEWKRAQAVLADWHQREEETTAERARAGEAAGFSMEAVDGKRRPAAYFPALTIRRLALVVQTIQGVDTMLGDLTSVGWRSQLRASENDAGLEAGITASRRSQLAGSASAPHLPA